MFRNLWKFISHDRKVAPLEDYTTELFVGLLNALPELKISFCRDFLGLESEFFSVSSQKFFALEGKKNCKVDIVIRGDQEVCFIENKVNSVEGDEQLERYSLVLDQFQLDGYGTKLVYCTKTDEPKGLKSHGFTQIKWQHISSFVNDNTSNVLGTLFIDFLKANGMAFDMKIYGKDILSIENFGRVFQMMHAHLGRVLPYFSDHFQNVTDARRGKVFEYQNEVHNRICIYSNPIITGKGWSEVLYGFDFKGVLVVQLFVSQENHYFEKIKEMGEGLGENSGLDFEITENLGVRIFAEKNLGDYLNTNDSEFKIEEWFKERVKSIHDLMLFSKSKIDWIILEKSSGSSE